MPAFSSLMPVVPIILLSVSNIFMMFAWYGHLKFPNAGIISVVLFSWCIAFFEYCLAVPANRIGYQFFSASELRTIQVVISLIIFSAFAVFYLDEKITFMHAIGFTLIAVGAACVFLSTRSI